MKFDFKNWKQDVLIGFAFLIGFIILNSLNSSVTIGFPMIPQATEGERTLIVGGFAPVGEELIFRVLLLFVLNMFVPMILAVFIGAGVFSFFHAKAYAGSYALQNISSNIGAFVGAFLFGTVAGLLFLWRKNPISCIILHMGFNLFLLGKYLVVVVL